MNHKSIDPGRQSQVARPEQDTTIAHCNQRIETVALVFDATGSMQPVWQEAKANIKKLATRCRELVPRADLGLIAYRDYDHKEKILEFFGPSSNVREISAFLDSVECIGGLTDPEAVEVALEQLVDLRPDFAILVGDSPPHGVEDEKQRDKDYKAIATQLGRQNTPVYTVTTNNYPAAVRSFGEIARLSGGKAFNLYQIDELIDLLSVAIAAKTNQIKKLVEMFGRENGGQITAKQRMLLLQAAKN